MALCLKIDFFGQRSEVALTLDPQASLVTVLPIITLNHFKIDRHKGPHILHIVWHGCRYSLVAGADIDVVLELEELWHVDGDGVTRLVRHYQSWTHSSSNYWHCPDWHYRQCAQLRCPTVMSYL